MSCVPAGEQSAEAVGHPEDAGDPKRVQVSRARPLSSDDVD